MAPTFAMLVGNMMIPEPIMFTATMNVSCIRFIFFFFCTTLSFVPASRASFTYGVCVELDAVIFDLLVDALHFVVEARESIERIFERQEIIQHRLCAIVPPLARNDHTDARRID